MPRSMLLPDRLAAASPLAPPLATPAGGAAGGSRADREHPPLFVAIILPSGENCGCVPLPPSGVIDMSLMWITCSPPPPRAAAALRCGLSRRAAGVGGRRRIRAAAAAVRVKTMPVPSGVQTIADAGVPGG